MSNQVAEEVKKIKECWYKAFFRGNLRCCCSTGKWNTISHNFKYSIKQYFLHNTGKSIKRGGSPQKKQS
ncbi:MAG TPA: hypothetical protein VHH33_01495 [Nitrososphaeraceae archaeon]|jgi:hypothetical protein|nr:hypothetical protein [Nitrososphaeraceae archaeon]